MLWLAPLVPAAMAVVIGAMPGRRGRLGLTAAAALVTTLAIAVWAAVERPRASWRWSDQLVLRLEPDPAAGVMAVLVAAVALPVVIYAAAHEETRGLRRLVALLLVFVAAMELLVLAGDVLTLLVGWELVGACSWALIGHEWWEGHKPAAAAHAFNATRLGDLGLFAAAGAALAGAGSLRYSDLGALDGGWLDLFAAGVLLAAAAKSAQVPFSPWLFSAMVGPTAVSALLHAATMVAAGAFALVRLHPVLDRTGWFGPAAMAVGLVTALAGGAVALMQPRIKHLLAASTSAQYGLMFTAAGAGYPAVALAHLVTHAVFKALLFLTAGIGIAATGSDRLEEHRLGSRLPAVAALSLAGALALGGVPPLGGAWTKEKVVAAAGEYGTWLAVLVVVAGFLSAAYAARFQWLAFGPAPPAGARGAPEESALPAPGRLPSPVEVVAAGVLAAATLALGLLWLPGNAGVVQSLTGGRLPSGSPWEVAASLGAVAVGVFALGWAARRRRLAGSRTVAADWLGLPVAVELGAVRPALGLARTLGVADRALLDAPVRGLTGAAVGAARLLALGDRRVVDAGVRGVAAFGIYLARVSSAVAEVRVDGTLRTLAAGVGAAGRHLRQLQTGLTHHYYALVAVGLVVAAGIAAVWR